MGADVPHSSQAARRATVGFLDEKRKRLTDSSAVSFCLSIVPMVLAMSAATTTVESSAATTDCASAVEATGTTNIGMSTTIATSTATSIADSAPSVAVATSSVTVPTTAIAIADAAITITAATPIAAIPRASAYEQAADKPARAVVAVRSAGVRRIVVIAPLANGSGVRVVVAVAAIPTIAIPRAANANSHTYLGLGGSGSDQEGCGNHQGTEQHEISYKAHFDLRAKAFFSA